MPSAVARAENTQQQQQRQEGKNNNDSKHQRNKKANKTVWDYLDGGGRPEEKRPLQLAKLSRGWQDVKKWVIEECKYAYWKVLGDGEGEGFRRRYRQSVVVDPERGDTIESEYEGDWDESRVA